MSEKELADALLKLDMSKTPDGADVRQLTRNVLERDRRRVRLWTVLTVLSWFAAAIVFYWYGFWLLGVWADLQRGNEPDVTLLVTELVKFLMVFSASVELLLVAFLCTLLLMRASRLATLRQVNANLKEISGQLNLLQGTPR